MCLFVMKLSVNTSCELIKILEILLEVCLFGFFFPVHVHYPIIGIFRYRTQSLEAYVPRGQLNSKKKKKNLRHTTMSCLASSPK